VSNLVRVILAEMVSELIATGELLLAHRTPERSLHHILRSIGLKGQWPTIVEFFKQQILPNKCLFLAFVFSSTSMRLSVPVRQKARMVALLGVLPSITLEKGSRRDLNCFGIFASPLS
jgi:hypothetical protein